MYLRSLLKLISYLQFILIHPTLHKSITSRSQGVSEWKKVWPGM